MKDCVYNNHRPSAGLSGEVLPLWPGENGCCSLPRFMMAKIPVQLFEIVVSRIVPSRARVVLWQQATVGAV
jgi:hypothetical protein